MPDPFAPLTEEQLTFFRANGFLHIPGLMPPAEIDAVRADMDRLIAAGIDERIDDPTYVYGADAQDQNRACLFRINELIRHHDLDSVRFMLAYPRLLGAISQATGGSPFAAQVHSCVFKVPHRGFPVPWHQDPVEVYRYPVFNVDIYLDEAHPGNGGLHVIPGSHLAGYHRDPGFVRHWTAGREEDAPGSIAVHTQPGDVLFHATSVLHGSFWNRSESLRRTIYLHINHLADILMRPEDEGHRQAWPDAQAITKEAIHRRAEAYPEETPFAYPSTPDATGA